MKLLKASGGSDRYQWWVILSVMLQVSGVGSLMLEQGGLRAGGDMRHHEPSG